MFSAEEPLFIGFDLSTQQLKGIVIQSDFKFIQEAKVDFDADLSKYGINKGVLTTPSEGEIFAPVAMWLEALDLVLDRLGQDGVDFSRVKAVSGAGMQHGTVFWSRDAAELLKSLDPGNTLLEQLAGGALGEKRGAFSHPFSPNWQDASTQKECEEFDDYLGGPNILAEVTGSRAHHRFSGPQILRLRRKHPNVYDTTSRISLVSSFLASLFLGKIAPIDTSDVCGMNLWDIKDGKWHGSLLELAAGGTENMEDLRDKLGAIPADGNGVYGNIAQYYTSRYGFPSDCLVAPFTGDNPATILALPTRASDAIISLGTSTTFLMSTPSYKPDPAYHFMNHPTTKGLYMFMLCYKNGGLAREKVRDAINSTSDISGYDAWDEFNSTATSSPPLNQSKPSDPMQMGLYFPRPEIVPNVRAGHWRFLYDSSSDTLTEVEPSSENSTADWQAPRVDVRTILESQFLSLRLRSADLVTRQKTSSGVELPPQPRRIYLVGGGSLNPAIADVCGQVLGGAEGVYRLDVGGNACALGAAYKAAWAAGRKEGEGFEEFIGQKWDERRFVRKVAEGYREGVWEKYGVALKGFEAMERRILERVNNERDLNFG